MSWRPFPGALLAATLGCGPHQPSTPAPAGPPTTATPPCFELYPLGAGARWTYDVNISAGDGDANTQESMRVVRVVAEASAAGAEWRFRVDTTPLPRDSAVEATEHFRLASGNLYDADDSDSEHLFLVSKPEQSAAWGGPRSFYPPGDGLWKVVDFEDAPPYHDCVKVRAELKYGEVVHVFCAGVGPVTSEYHERAPRSRTDAALGHHRDEVWRLREVSAGACAR